MVLMNLLLNAIKHSSENVVRVSMLLTSNYDSKFLLMKVGVRDYGSGIKPDVLK